MAAGGYGGTATILLTKSYLALMQTQVCAQKLLHCTMQIMHRSVLNQKHIVEERRRPWNTPLLSFGVLLSWCSAILVLCHSGALPFWCSAILALCHSGTLPWCWPFCWCPQSHCEPAALRQQILYSTISIFQFYTLTYLYHIYTLPYQSATPMLLP